MCNMGANTSKQINQSKQATYRDSDSNTSIINEKTAYQDDIKVQSLQNKLRGLEVATGDLNPRDISIEVLDDWEKTFTSDSKNRLAQNAFAKNDIKSVVGVADAGTNAKSQFFFNTEVATIGSPAFFDNQRLSGRCWIFATTNVLRTQVIKNYKLKEDNFQISQAYLYFYDKLEKANFFLQNILETVDEPLDSRLIQYLLSNPVNDGGQWDMVTNLLEKYGAIPIEFFPDNAQTKSTSQVNYIVTEKLREYALVLRELKTKGVSDKDILSVKNSMVKEVYNIISLTIGTPPKPTDKLVWEFKDKNGTYKHFEITPKSFYSDHVRYDAKEHFSLINDPRNEYSQLYTVDRLNNIYGGKPIEYVNTHISDLKTTAIRMLKDNEPIFFGSDVGKFNEGSNGVLDVSAFDYNLAFGTDLNLSKLERLKTGSSQMTHAMVITAVHIDPETNKPIRWKIENSWGDNVGDHGYYVMTDKWFDEYVFQIVTSRKYVDRKFYDIWKKKDFKVLPYFDPMGALA